MTEETSPTNFPNYPAPKPAQPVRFAHPDQAKPLTKVLSQMMRLRVRKATHKPMRRKKIKIV